MLCMLIWPKLITIYLFNLDKANENAGDEGCVYTCNIIGVQLNYIITIRAQNNILKFIRKWFDTSVSRLDDTTVMLY